MLTNGSVAVLDTQSLERLLKQLQQGTLQGVGALQVRNATAKLLAISTAYKLCCTDKNSTAPIIDPVSTHHADRSKWSIAARKLPQNRLLSFWQVLLYADNPG